MDLFNSYLDRQITLNSMANSYAGGSTSGPQFMRTNNPMQKGGGLQKGDGLNQSTQSGLSDATFKKRNKPVQQEMKGEEKKAIEGEEAEEADEDGDIQLSGHVGGGHNPPDEGKHNDTDAAPSQPQGFSKLIDELGQEFPNSRSRKSVVFVPNDKALPLKGWKSLRNAGLTSKKLGKISKNGDNFVHTAKDGSEGSMYFLNNNAWKSLRRK
jgi:hypothetical protein